MKRWLFPALILLLVIPAYVWVNGEMWAQQAQTRSSVMAGYVLPSQFNRIMALEYKGLLSNFQFLKLVTFFGDRVISEEGLSGEDWDYLVAGLESVTDLDPYFLDPYLFGESLLTWEAGRIESANRLLEKGMRHRKDDWQLPFYIGFNYFYFLQDFEKGSEYLMKASLLPDSPSFLPALAARLSYYGNQAGTAVVFLKSMLLQTTDPRVRARLETRVLALDRATFIEEKVAEFVRDRGYPPEDLSELAASGYLTELPADPYGGEWRLLESGRVFTTSKFVEGAGGKEKDK